MVDQQVIQLDLEMQGKCGGVTAAATINDAAGYT